LDESVNDKMEKGADELLRMAEEDPNILPGHPFYLMDYAGAVAMAWSLSGLAGLPGHKDLSEEAGVDSSLSERAFQLALLQHYGVPTPALDVTYDPLIALWFATYRFISIKERAGYYAKSDDTGVVYIN
jgi:hypothetical protein